MSPATDIVRRWAYYHQRLILSATGDVIPLWYNVRHWGQCHTPFSNTDFIYMSIKRKVLPGILSLGIILSIVGNTAIANSQEATMNKRNKFAKIEQPLVLKVAVTLGGLGLIGAEVWWFVLSKPKAQRQK